MLTIRVRKELNVTKFGIAFTKRARIMNICMGIVRVAFREGSEFGNPNYSE